MNLNEVKLIGRVGRDPEKYTSNSGSQYCFFTLATNKKAKDGTDIVQWHPIQAWEKLSDLIINNVKKGALLYVAGEIKYRVVEEAGKKFSLPTITAFKVLFLEPKADKQPNKPNYVNGNLKTSPPQGNNHYTSDGYVSDDIPF